MNRVPVAETRLEDYVGIVPDDILDSIQTLARQTKGLRYLHVNATPAGGGVAEILKSLVPLMRSVGIDAEWYAIEPHSEFFNITKVMHNALQGGADWLSDSQMNLYMEHNRRAAELFMSRERDADLFAIHDAQVLPFHSFLKTNAPAAWICHVDTTQPSEQMRQLVLSQIHSYSRVIFSMDEYRLQGLDPANTLVFPPAIDPLTPKNQRLARDAARQALVSLGIDPTRPIITQISRFDLWKDPWGVVDAYRIARQSVPGLQLALVGAMDAKDDPEALTVLDSVERYVADDPDVHLYSESSIIGPQQVRAFQAGSDVVLQKSTREGFGLTVAEAMWKGVPVIGGDCGGIRQQIQDGVTGFLVSDVETCANRIVSLLTDDQLASRMAHAGQESVRRDYLMPRLLKNYLELAISLLGSGQPDLVTAEGQP